MKHISIFIHRVATGQGKQYFFKVSVKSGNFVGGQGILIKSLKVRERSGNFM